MSRAPEEELACKVRFESHQPTREWVTLSRESISKEKKRSLWSTSTQGLVKGRENEEAYSRSYKENQETAVFSNQGSLVQKDPGCLML